MSNNYLNQYMNELQSRGRYTFTVDEVYKTFPKEKDAVYKAVNRLADKNRIIRIRNGFYIIVPAEYAAQGILPPSLFIHDLMQFLDKPYYVALLSAAALHGAAHQQPQTFMVMTAKPAIRALSIKSIHVKFIVKDDIADLGIEQKKTDTGYIRISDPLLTALDLIRFERHCGGFERVLEVINELAEHLNRHAINAVLNSGQPLSVVQRFGFICDRILNLNEMAESVESYLKEKKIHPVPLSRSSKSRAGVIDKRWQVIHNVEWEDAL